jgi:hypothetical protein
MVRRWRKSILDVAKEEMGHLLTVQNVLTLLGAPINLDRQDFPWDIKYYPFPFKLERFTMDSLSAYVYAEMPRDVDAEFPKKKPVPPRYQRFEKEDLPAIKASVNARLHGAAAHEVGAIYAEIIALLDDRVRIPDSAFEDSTYAMQGSWDDWGRGYQPDPRLVDAEGNPIEASDALPPASAREAHVIIDRIATRTEALAALRALSAQGEAPHLGDGNTGEPSHFDRFLEIYQEYADIEKQQDEGKEKPWSPSRPVAADPTTLEPDATDPEPPKGTYIESEHSRNWASLFNLRYRILLTYLSHTFHLARTTRQDVPNVRAVMMHRVFGEMYNLKTIADILVRLPLKDGAGPDAACAGPPFEMPYTLALPPAEIDAWRLHRDLIGSAQRRTQAMLADSKKKNASKVGQEYLTTMIDLDGQARAWLDATIAGLDPAEEQRKDRSAKGVSASARGRV